jgi:hypothetical protein
MVTFVGVMTCITLDLVVIKFLLFLVAVGVGV